MQLSGLKPLIRSCRRGMLLPALFIILLFPFSLIAQENTELQAVEALMLKEDYSQACSKLEKIAETDSLNPGVFYLLGLTHQKLYNYKKSIPAFYRAAELDSNNTNALIALGSCYRENGSDALAAGIFLRAFSKEPSNLTAGLKLGSTLIDLQNYSQAENVYKTLLRQDSSNGYIYRQLGYCYEKMYNDPEDTLLIAIDCFRKATRLNSEDLISLQHYIKNILNANKDRLTFEALDYTLNLLGGRNNDPVVNRLAGDIYFRLNRYTEAIRHYNIALKNGDSTAYLYQKLGVSHLNRAGNLDTVKFKFDRNILYKEAEAMLSRSLEKDYSPVTLYFIAKALNRLSRFGEAADKLTSAVGIIVPGLMYDIYLSLGENYLALREFEKTIEAYKAVLHYNPNRKEMLCKIAEIYDRALDNKTMALRYYSDYLGSAEKSGSNNPALADAPADRIADNNTGNMADIKKRIKELEKALKN